MRSDIVGKVIGGGFNWSCDSVEHLFEGGWLDTVLVVEVGVWKDCFITAPAEKHVGEIVEGGLW